MDTLHNSATEFNKNYNPTINLFTPWTNYRGERRPTTESKCKAQAVTLDKLEEWCNTPEARAARAAVDTDPNTYRRAKTFCPAIQVTSSQWPSRACPRSTEQALQRQTGLFSVDIDHIDHIPDFNRLKARWLALPGLVFYGLSVSGKGFYLVYRTTHHWQSAAQYSEWYKREVLPMFGGHADPACNDISRLRFLGVEPPTVIQNPAGWWVDTHPEPLPERGTVERVGRDTGRPAASRAPAIVSTRSSWYQREHLSRHIEEILSLPVGQRHTGLFIPCLKVASDCLAGLADWPECRALLIEAVAELWGGKAPREEIDTIDNAYNKAFIRS